VIAASRVFGAAFLQTGDQFGTPSVRKVRRGLIAANGAAGCAWHGDWIAQNSRPFHKSMAGNLPRQSGQPIAARVDDAAKYWTTDTE
jgi:hypothetical protein